MPNKDKKDFSDKLEQENKFEEKEAEQEAVEELEEEAAEGAVVPEKEDSAGAGIADGAMGKEAEYLDGWKRCQADFENYKKRQAESQKDLIRYSTQNIVLQILPVIDNFHSATGHIPENQKEDPWVTGIMYIQKQLEQVLTDNGVTEMETKAGDNFDPARHEAVEDRECKSCKSKDYKFQNKIKRIVARGYRMGDKVVRPARVIVE
ncbi:MAG: nucleotide exchange factor GrpE [Candidatus Moranbacteria bacterium]|nr:nucleotide exchange factor GrpE [bacterium]MDP1833561.1 nucleotide exchange factor GrpE [Candidatus Moranbacteria bacterium]